MSARSKRRRGDCVPTADSLTAISTAPEAPLPAVHISQEQPALPGPVAQENRQQVQLTIQNVWRAPDEMLQSLSASLCVQLQAPSGAGLASAPVALHFGGPDGPQVAATCTDVQGQAQFHRLPPGYYTVSAGLEGDFPCITLPPLPLLPGERAVRTVVALHAAARE